MLGLGGLVTWSSHMDWTRDQLLIAFRFYCRTPFGRLHYRNPEIIRLAEVIGRTPSALAMTAQREEI